MAKLNRSKTMLFILLAIALIALSSCEKAECRTSGDCAPKACSIQRCADSKCAYTLQQNCCGNGIKDALENGKPGNQCTCPQDYGKCEGKPKVKAGSKTEDSKYLHYYCSTEGECALGADEGKVVPQNILDTINTGFFKASSVFNYNNLFDITNDDFQFSLSLDDAGKDVELPVQITKIQLFFTGPSAKNLLVAEKYLEEIINYGAPTTIIMPLNLDFRPAQAEETGSLKYIIHYTYNKKIKIGKTPDGEDLFTRELVRGSFSSPAKNVIFLKLATDSAKKTECESNSDCTPKKCTASKCVEKKCTYSPHLNCCGNGIKEETEDDNLGNECTCPEDYGRCEGPLKFKGSAGTENAKYLFNYCNSANQCVFKVNEDYILLQNFLDKISTGYFKASSIIKYNNPFDIKAEKFQLKITLDDMDENLVPPVSIDRIRLFASGTGIKGELLISEKNINKTLNSVGSGLDIEMLLNLGYTPQYPEEPVSLKYGIDYTYYKKTASGIETVRGTYNAASKSVTFIQIP